MLLGILTIAVTVLLRC